MDPTGRIHKLPVPKSEEEIAQFRKELEAMGIDPDDLVPIPDKQLPKVKKMNAKARRRWYAQQRRKMRGRTT